MKNFNFESVLQTYETERNNIKRYNVLKENEEEIHVIKVDIDRSFKFLREVSDDKKEKLRRILYEVLISIPIEYVQGMSEIASVFVYYYFNKEIDEDADEEEHIELEDELLNKTRIVVTNALKEKYEPLVNNDFKLYLHYNSVFIKMMEKRKKKVVLEESIKFMNDTLTWFVRNVESIEDIYALIGYMLACPTSFPFLLVVRFYDEINARKSIGSLDTDLYEQLIVLESEFLETEEDMKNVPLKISKRDLVIVGATVAIAGALLYKFFKRDD